MTALLQATAALPAGAMACVRRRAIFECCKWDPQVGDTAVLADFALTLTPATWRELATAAEALYHETLLAEAEIAARPELIKVLALPRRLARVLLEPSPPIAPPGEIRVMRFDFHPTSDGWAVSEVNSDVPGGYIEAAGYSSLMAGQIEATALTADPVAILIEALQARRPDRTSPVGLVHATAYTDDRQVMGYLQQRLLAAGFTSRLLGPDDIVWRDGVAAAGDEVLAALLRFFPVEWLPNLPGRAWLNYFRPTVTPQINPGRAALSQSKRFPLTWPRLRTATATWRSLAPETVAWSAGLDDTWVSKPSFGRVGDGIGLSGATTEREWREIRRSRRSRPVDWVAQRRFESQPCATPGGPVHVCLGVYVIAGRAAGIYGRITRRPLIDHHARDVAVLVHPDATASLAMKSA